MLRKMYLVSPDYLNTVTSKNSPPSPPQTPNTEKAGKKHNSSERLRCVKNKYLSQREHDRWVAKRSAARRGRDYDKWFNVRGKLLEADIERKNQIKTVADFLKQVLPVSPSLGYADRTWSPRETRTTTTSSCNPHKTTFSI